ncbi:MULTISPECIES: MsnO8 family LLM class oxidoreductase [unclassified Micromonospora]|uniref:MsnO8 family LLM class oxidoreductase n=1 Tax=unclassified Micromonospora TaxID=2617518 RepID=UPI00362C725E
MTLRLSVLDQSLVPDGTTSATALRQTVELAAELDGLGFTRFWVAEHHHAAGFAGVSPDVLVATVLENTRAMRVGSGGVLLPRHDPMRVAETFTVLAELHPGRVDLGLGRAGGPAETFPAKLSALTAGLRQLATSRAAAVPPQVWLLGAGTRSALLAAERGANFCFGHFLDPRPALDVLDAYRQRFVPPTPPAPRQSALAVRVVVAETTEEVRDLTEAVLLWRSRRDLGHDERFPSPEATRRHDWTPAEQHRRFANTSAVFCGTPEQVRTALTQLADVHGVEELVINTLVHDPKARLRSYQLLAEAFELVSR